ncbi:MAG: BON domain-containing protein [Candidatus Omnitrophota bacterium]
MGKLLKEILAQLDDAGIDCGPLKIEIDEDGGILLKGEICSFKEKETVMEIIEESFGIENITDELTVLEGIVDEEAESPGEKKVRLEEEDDDSDTEDIYQSIEDGIPYTPPSEPLFREEEHPPRKKKKNNG